MHLPNNTRYGRVSPVDPYITGIVLRVNPHSCEIKYRVHNL